MPVLPRRRTSKALTKSRIPKAAAQELVLAGAITLTTETDVQILMAMGEYGTATRETLVIEEEKPVPSGFLDADESHQFNVTIPQQMQEEEEQASSNTWKWVVGLLLLAAGL